MKKNLKKRKWGRVVRLEVPVGSDPRLLTRIKKYLDVAEEGVFSVPGPLNLDYFMKQISYGIYNGSAEEIVAQMQEALKAAGIDDVTAELQKQFDELYK